MSAKNILAVDDDSSILLYLEQVLGVEGYRVQTATGGREALELLQSEIPDLMLLDVQMPEMGGFELLEAIRSQEQSARVPVIFLTVKDAPSEEARGLKEGVADYLSKEILTPERVEILLYRLRNFFARQENELLRGVLATIVSTNHEINNPLMVMQGNLDLLRLKGLVSDQVEGQKAMENMAGACRRIKDALMEIATLTSWKVKPYLDGVEMLNLEKEPAVGISEVA